MEYAQPRRMLVSAVQERIIALMEERVPEKGIFRSFSVAMRYYGTEHEGRLYVEYSMEHSCAVRASMIAGGTDRMISNYVFFGSRQECLDWLRDVDRVEALVEIYDHLATRADAME